MLSLEIASINSQIIFLITCDKELVPFVEAQIQSNYPLVIIERIEDPLGEHKLSVKELTLRRGNYFPINTYPLFQDVDPLSSILTVLAKLKVNEFAMVQYSLESISGSWQGGGQRYAETGGGKTEEGVYIAHPEAAIIKEKISFPGFAVSLRLIGSSQITLNALASSFGVFAKSDGNSLVSRSKGVFGRRSLINDARNRRVTDRQILNISEIATIWHLPSEKVKIPSIVWGTSVLSEAPENLPVSQDKTDEEKQNINFFAKAPYKNKETTFGVSSKDRRRHMWVVGKTGTGKSTLIANMAIDDIKKGQGIAVIDPHGDLCETILDYIPSHRINDVVYFNPFDRDHPIVINPLEVTSKEEAELVVSGLMSIFTKIWANVWSARMEYILRNTLLTLSQVPETTFADVLTILTDRKYRDRICETIDDHSLKQFWITEYNQMPDRLQKESISPIQNKVGQFVTSPLIRKVIGSPKSTIHLDEVMDEGKILLANLSQGKIGEDNSALLGATLITKLQQGAMQRVNIDEEKRRDFYLYVDEFQNFATTSFIKILSEARKYRLNLMLANQYMAQIPEDVQKAILGNVGSLISFGVGAEDAEVIHKEFSEVFSQNDLVNLSNFQVAVKLMVEGHASRPFLAHTLPEPASKNQNRETVIQVSRERWSQKPGTDIKSHGQKYIERREAAQARSREQQQPQQRQYRPQHRN
ncbi:MAG: hypothetical protein UV74_C0002G0054 [Candidatus Woesebacteria bacterium GW2011_GWB1_43_14]|uniref:Type IV secretion system coupling protein TraD DNA-binding domain-containing protein n=1 Tax=Candidatus Woesebacteria bacterium GW2011_GWB1_43_14 TaxID=1618578 RepID=A0A0G1DMG9_9BACT|nr:MAG: hypothetical protein UV51_C0004G0003 [Candidatus Woesebacteria bacterium GW2011_GWC1_42_9]KKS98834.1 MAG: hypothetical protein UV74_C0002G0054 [Candidatus Woesebacteria bacterium GW2011_GWB1_43_14]